MYVCMYVYVSLENPPPGPGNLCTADRALIPTLAFLPGDGRGFYHVFCFLFYLFSF